MNVASKYNKGSIFNFSIPKDFEYRSLVDLFNDNGKDKIYIIKALYINKKSRYGESPVVATDNCLVNLPMHLTDTVKEMLKDEDFISAVNHDLVGFKIYPYESKNSNGVCYSVNWCDL